MRMQCLPNWASSAPFTGHDGLLAYLRHAVLIPGGWFGAWSGGSPSAGLALPPAHFFRAFGPETKFLHTMPVVAAGWLAGGVVWVLVQVIGSQGVWCKVVKIAWQSLCFQIFVR